MPTWTNAVSGDWGTSSNWTGGVPNAIGATAIFNNLGLGSSDLAINLGGVTRTVGALTLNAFPFVAYVLHSGTLNMQSSSGFSEITANVQNTSNNNAMGWFSNVTLQLSNTTSINVQTNGTLISGGAITGSGTLTKSGGGNLQLDGANSTRTGNTIVTAGTLNLNATNALGSGRLTVEGTGTRLELNGFSQSTGALLSSFAGVINSAAAATLTLNQTTSGFYQGTISGAISLVKNGADLLALQAQNTYTGTTTVNAGSLSLQHVNALSASSVVTVNAGGTLYIDISNTNIRGLEGAGSVTSALGGSATITIAGGNGGNFSGAITNGIGSPLAMVFNAGVTYLSGNGNTYTGGTTINGGTVVIGAGGTTGSIGTGTVTINGGTFGLFRSGDFTFANAVAGAGTFEKNLAGIVTLTGNNSGFTGTIGVNGGTLRGSDANSFGSGAAWNIASGATLDLNNGVSGTTYTIRSLSGGGTLQTLTNNYANLIINQSVNTTFSGVIADNGGQNLVIQKLGTGTLTLTGVNTVSDNIFIGNDSAGGGTIALSGAGSIASATAVSVYSNSTLDISGISAASTAINDLHGRGGSVVLGGRTLTITQLRSLEQNLTFIGSAGADGVNIALSNGHSTHTFDLSLYTLTNWTDGTDFFTLTGNGSANTLSGTNIRDVINGAGGADIIDGRGGNDTLNGDDGNDTIDGSAGNDTISGGNDNDTLRGGADDDTLYGDDGNDTIEGGDGTDRLYGGNNDDTLRGGAGIDSLFGEAGADTIDGGTSADYISAGAGDDVVYYDSADTFSNVFGGADNDTLIFIGGSLPTSLNIAAQQFEFARHEQSDTGNTVAWNTITDTYNASWQLVFSNRINDDLTRAYTSYDRGALAWDLIVESFNAANVRTQQQTYNDDVSRRADYWDFNNTETWSQTAEFWNAANQRLRQNITNDDTSYRFFYWDPTNIESWTTFDEEYNTASVRTVQRIQNDDGTSSQQTWDVANAFNYSSYVDYYNAANQRNEQRIFFDQGPNAGGYTRTFYDVTNAQVWQQQIDTYNAAGVLTGTVFVPD